MPMPYPYDPRPAHTWNIGAPCVTISEDQIESALSG